MVSSAVVLFVNAPPREDHRVEFSFGGTLNKPTVSTFLGLDQLCKTPRWTRLPHLSVECDNDSDSGTLGDLFTIKRGLATGCNSFFILTPERAQRHALPTEFLRPILPSPRDIESNELFADEGGEPLISKRRYLLDCDLLEERIRTEHPNLWLYLEHGMEEGIHERYLCRHRDPWYCQENRPPAPLLCTYMGRPTARRESPFRFILNHSRATAAHVYLMLHPKPRLSAILQRAPELIRTIWESLSD